MVERTRIFGGKEYIYKGTYPHPDIVDNAKDRLKFSAWANNRFVAFRTVKRNPMEYELFYRFHADIKKRRK